MISHRDLKVQEHECGKRLVTREAWFGAKIVLVKENVTGYFFGLAGAGTGCALGTLGGVSASRTERSA